MSPDPQDPANSIITPDGVSLALPPPPVAADTDQVSQVTREVPEISDARKALVNKWIDRVKSGKSRWAKDFKRMSENLRFSSGRQWSNSVTDDKYVCNITLRHLQQKTATLYAKDPTITCKKKERMDYSIWDENLSSLGIVQQQLATAAQTGVLNTATQQFITDFSQGTQIRQRLNKIARTLQLLMSHQLETQQPPFKLNMKQLVRRVLATGVGYVKIGFKRTLKPRPEDVSRVNVITEAIAQAQRISNDAIDEEIQADNADLEQLRLQLQQAENNMRNMIDFEGLTFDFPKSTQIIVDPNCRHLRTFTGAQWIAHEFVLSRDQIQEIYNVDVKGSFTTSEGTVNGSSENHGHCVWEIYDKSTGQVMTVMSGYEDFLREPASPEFFLDRFWPVFPLCFNEIESDEDDEHGSIFPQSDVDIIRPVQNEYNRSREGLRQQRIANRPRQVVAAGALDEGDKVNLSSAAGNSVIELRSLGNGEDIRSKIMAVPVVPIDPQLYSTDAVFQDMLRSLGQQEANLGGTSNSTATESSIAASSQASSLSSNIDDLDDMLREIAQAGGLILLEQMSQETVQQIVGRGAVWPTDDTEAVSTAIGLDIEAGSSGRPNRALEIQNFERLLPYLMQIPGIKPEFVAREAIRRLDDGIDLADAWVENVPSMIAMNSQKMAPVPGGPAGANNPQLQGQNGGQNDPSVPGSQAGGPPQKAPSITPPPQ